MSQEEYDDLWANSRKEGRGRIRQCGLDLAAMLPLFQESDLVFQVVIEDMDLNFYIRSDHHELSFFAKSFWDKEQGTFFVIEDYRGNEMGPFGWEETKQKAKEFLEKLKTTKPSANLLNTTKPNSS